MGGLARRQPEEARQRRAGPRWLPDRVEKARETGPIVVPPASQGSSTPTHLLPVAGVLPGGVLGGIRLAIRVVAARPEAGGAGHLCHGCVAFSREDELFGDGG